MFRQNKVSICFLNTRNEPEWISGGHVEMVDSWLVLDWGTGVVTKYPLHRIIAVEHTQEEDRNVGPFEIVQECNHGLYRIDSSVSPYAGPHLYAKAQAEELRDWLNLQWNERRSE